MTLAASSALARDAFLPPRATPAAPPGRPGLARGIDVTIRTPRRDSRAKTARGVLVRPRAGGGGGAPIDRGRGTPRVAGRPPPARPGDAPGARGRAPGNPRPSAPLRRAKAKTTTATAEVFVNETSAAPTDADADAETEETNDPSPSAAPKRRKEQPPKRSKRSAAQAVGPSGPSASDPSSSSTPAIDLIVTDVDGTLLGSDQTLSASTEAAIARAAALGVPCVVATGKSRGPWARELLPRLGADAPGVFVQGLVTCEADGTVLESVALDAAVAERVIRFADDRGVTAVAFCGETILCDRRNEDTDRLLAYGEPTPEAAPAPGGLREAVALGGVRVNKLLLFAAEEEEEEETFAGRDKKDATDGGVAMSALREEAERAFSPSECAITTAVPGMLEFLPPGTSKGAAVARLLKYLEVDPSRVLALGDGENDAEMLELCGVAVAVKGSSDRVVRAAGGNVSEYTNDEGAVADAIERYVLRPRGVSAADDAAGWRRMTNDAAEEDETAARGAKDSHNPGDASEGGRGPRAKAKARIKTEAIAAAVAAAEASAEMKRARKAAEARKRERAAEAEKAAKAEKAAAKKKPAPPAKKKKKKNDGSDSAPPKTSAGSNAAAVAASSRDSATVAAETSAARRANLELLAASKEASARLARLRDEMRATEAALRETERAEIGARLRAGGWGEDDRDDAEFWGGKPAGAGTANERSERAPGTPSGSSAGTRSPRAGTAAEPEVVAAADGPGPATASLGASSTGPSTEAPPAGFGLGSLSVGSLFASALDTVSRLTTPEARRQRREADLAASKARLLASVVSTNIGREVDAEKLDAVRAAFLDLERCDPSEERSFSFAAGVAGRWSVVFTDSLAMLGEERRTGGFALTKQSGPVYVGIDPDAERAEVEYTWPIKTERAALLAPTFDTRDATASDERAGSNGARRRPGPRRIEMRFEKTSFFGLFGLSTSRPTREYGNLEITFMDPDVMLARGGNSTAYVFVRTDASWRVDGKRVDGGRKALPTR